MIYYASYGIFGLVIVIPFLLYYFLKDLFTKTVYEYTTYDFKYAKKAYEKGYVVKKQRIDGVNWTQFNPYIKNRDDYIFKVVGISKEELEKE